MKRVFFLLTFSFFLNVFSGFTKAAIAKQHKMQQVPIQLFSEKQFQHHVEAISHDSTQGRATPSAGLESTANYIAHHFEDAGLTAYGDDNSYFQKYPIKEMSIDKEKTVITNSDGTILWNYINDFTRGGGGGTFRPGLSKGELVIIAGYSLDMEQIKAANLTGKIVLYILPEDINAENSSTAIMNVFRIASQGAAMVLWSSLRTDEQWKKIKNNPENYLTPYTESGWQKPSDRKPPNTSFFEVKSSSVSSFLKTMNLNFEKLSNPEEDFFLLKNYKNEITLDVKVKTEQISWPSNVIGIIEGNDPELKDEYVVYTAHYDHLGFVKGSSSGDRIHNGADDNASGTAALIMMAKLFSDLDQKPKRSIIFCAVSGEEIGLLGSNYFVRKFPQAKNRIVANINADMIGSAFRTDTVFALGMEYSSMGEMLNSIIKKEDIKLAILNTKQVDHAYPGQELFNRSDHINFVMNGIPAVFFFTGLHEHYHEPGDEIDIINAQTSLKIIKTMFYLGLRISNSVPKPEWKIDYERLY